MDCSPPSSSVHGISQARVLQWVSISSSRGSSQPRDQTCASCVSCLARQIFYHQHHLGIIMSILRQFFQLLLLKSWVFPHKHSHSFDSFFNKIVLHSHLVNFHTWCFHYHPVLSILLFYLLYFLSNQVIILSLVLTFKAYGLLRYSLVTDFCFSFFLKLFTFNFIIYLFFVLFIFYLFF